jgi:hypothetical protein
MLNVGLEQQQQVRGGDGSLLWCGGVSTGQTWDVLVASGNTGPLLGELVQFDSTNSVIPRPETTAAGASPSADLPMSLAIYGNVSPASANAVNIIGVAQQPIAAAGKAGIVAGPGSIVGVKTTAAAIAVGALVGASATAGLAAVVSAGLVTNNVVGAVLKINTVAAPGTGSTGFAGIIIKGGSFAAS